MRVQTLIKIVVTISPKQIYVRHLRMPFEYFSQRLVTLKYEKILRSLLFVTLFLKKKVKT